VGLALSDPLMILAGGAGVLPNDGMLLDRLAELIRLRDVSRVVVGMPYAPDGGLGARGRQVTAFVNDLTHAAGVPVDTWDESQSSKEAQRALIAGGVRKKRRREPGQVDEMAARLILQEYLEHLHRDQST
jgi:putative Holliday junction resolvase